MAVSELRSAQPTSSPDIAQGKKPCVFIDTGPLLTLLLSDADIPGHKDIGMLQLIVDMARAGDIKVVITDMVLAEFLNSPVPLHNQDLQHYYTHKLRRAEKTERFDKLNTMERRMLYSEGDRVKTYSKALERVDFLQQLAELNDANKFEVVHTRCGEQYMNLAFQTANAFITRRNSEIDQTNAKIRANNGHTKGTVEKETLLPAFPVFNTQEEMREWLLQPHKPQSPARKQVESVIGAIKRQGIRSDTGEISIADALLKFRSKARKNPRKRKEVEGFYPIILYESKDVRGHIIQRINKPNAPLSTEIEREFNPHTPNPKTFNAASLDALGAEGSLLTTFGFIAPFIMRARQCGLVFHDYREMDNPWQREELPDPGQMQLKRRDDPDASSLLDTYKQIAATAAQQMGGRYKKYHALKDVPFSQITPAIRHEHALNFPELTHPKSRDVLRSPWMDYVFRLPEARTQSLLTAHAERRINHSKAHIRMLKGQIKEVEQIKSNLQRGLKTFRQSEPAQNVDLGSGVMHQMLEDIHASVYTAR